MFDVVVEGDDCNVRCNVLIILNGVDGDVLMVMIIVMLDVLY